jgi:hypothetical protein
MLIDAKNDDACRWLMRLILIPYQLHGDELKKASAANHPFLLLRMMNPEFLDIASMLRYKVYRSVLDAFLLHQWMLTSDSHS